MKKAVSVTSNLIATSVAAVLSASLIMSGTWAWQSFDQEVDNKSSGSIGAGGRIHTNFNGVDKEIFVENYKDPIGTEDPYVSVGGNDIYVRVRMDEYLEVGVNAGTKVNRPNDGSIKPQGNVLADINDPDTWDTIYLVDGVASGFEKAREYVTLVLGGGSVYMPTFNKNDDSTQGIINGTLAGKDGDNRTLDDAYSDYVKYSMDGVNSYPDNVIYVTATATYDMDDNDKEEEEPVIYPEDNPNIYQANETHYTQETLVTTKVITMKEWGELFDDYDDYEKAIKEDPELELTLQEPESPVGPYWVFDEDGWIYWAQPLEPQTATGLLVNTIITHKKYEGEWYYEISTRAQYATRGDWGDVNDETGFYDEGVTAEALVLLQTVSGTVIK